MSRGGRVVCLVRRERLEMSGLRRKDQEGKCQVSMDISIWN